MIQLPEEQFLLDVVSEGLAGMDEPFRVREHGAFSAALARARNMHLYEGVDDPIALAVGYSLFKIHHPLIDGNKRAGYWALLLVLANNGSMIDAAQIDPDTMEGWIRSAASGDLSEVELIGQLRTVVVPLDW